MSKNSKKEKTGKFKSNFLDALGEIAVELIVGGVFLLIGVSVYWIFGKTIDWDAVDPETVMYIGMLAVAVIGVFIWILHRIFNKKNK